MTGLLVALGRALRACARLFGFGRRALSAPRTGVRVGVDFDKQDVQWPELRLDRAPGVLVLAASGGGKGHLVGGAIVRSVERDAEQPESPATVVIDPKRDMVELVECGIAAQVPGALSRLSILLPFERPLPLNFCLMANREPAVFALELASVVSATSAGIGDARIVTMGPKQLEALALFFEAPLTSTLPTRNLMWAWDALRARDGHLMLSRIAGSERVARALREMRPLSEDLASACASRVRTTLALTPAIEAMTCARSMLSFSDLTAPGHVTLVDLSAAPTKELRAVWSNLLAKPFFELGLARRSPWQGHHIHLCIDEAPQLAPTLRSVAEDTATTGRSKGLAATYLAQGSVLIEQASPELYEVLLANSPTKFIGRLAAPDAIALGLSQAPSVGVEESFKAVQEHFAGRVANLEDREFFMLAPGVRRRFRTVDVPLDDWREAARERGPELEAARSRHALREIVPRVTLSEACAKPAVGGPGSAPRLPPGAAMLEPPQPERGRAQRHEPIDPQPELQKPADEPRSADPARTPAPQPVLEEVDDETPWG